MDNLFNNELIMKPIKKKCVYCNKKILDYSINKIKRFCSSYCCAEDYKKQGKRRLAIAKYNKTERFKQQQKKYSLSKKGIKGRIKRDKILWENLKLARKIKKLKLNKKKLNNKQIKHLERYEKYLISIKKQAKKYNSKPEVKERKKKNAKKYYTRPEVKERIKLYRKKFFSTPRGKALRKERTNRRRALKINAVPKWCNLEKIKEIYKNCPKGYHVDHIIPLNNPIVCGLHVENNLQYLTAKENTSKGNKLLYDR